MGRRTYDQGDKVDGLVDSPSKVEHFVLTHDDPEQVAKGEIALTFVTTIYIALKTAKAATGDRNAAVGCASIAQRFITKAGLLDEMQINLVPVLLGRHPLVRLYKHRADRTKTNQGDRVPWKHASQVPRTKGAASALANRVRVWGVDIAEGR